MLHGLAAAAAIAVVTIPIPQMLAGEHRKHQLLGQQVCAAQRAHLGKCAGGQGGRGLPQQEKLRIVYRKKIYQLAFRRKIAHAGKLGFRLGF